jgi:excisionase family DNA binding protein
MAAPPPLPLDEQLRDVILLSVPQAAKHWSISTATIYRMIGRGELRVVYLGSIARVPATEMRAWIDRHLAHPPVAGPTPLRRSAGPRRS